MTALELISKAMRLIGALAPGESPTAQEAKDGLESLNLMIDSWSIEKLMIFSIVREEFTLVPSQQAYSIGPAGNFNAIRPQRVERAFLLDETSSPGTETPIRILQTEEWAAIPNKGTDSAIPTDLYHEPSFPLANLHFYPKPNAAKKVVLYSWKPISEIGGLNVVMTFPPGYVRPIAYNLAIEIAPDYGRAVPTTVASIALESKAAIKSFNQKPSYLQITGLPVSSGGGGNIFSGGSQ